MYNYREAVAKDIKDYISEEIDLAEYEDRDELEAQLNDALWTVDSVTGNGSGSYTFNRWRAKEYVTDNLDLLRDMCSEMGTGAEEIGRLFLDEEWETMDVYIRCYLLGQVLAEVLDEMEF